MIRFAAPGLTYWADRRRDGSEFEERSARSSLGAADWTNPIEYDALWP
jgi:hypothetical protein